MYYQRALKTHDATYLIIAECNFALLSVVEKERLEQTETAPSQVVINSQDSFHQILPHKLHGTSTCKI